jgi:lipopolysaccharide biosynthesis regulator YciM
VWNFALAELGVARISISTNRRDSALAYTKMAAKALPRNTEAQIILGKLLAVTGNTEGAIREWKTAESLDPTLKQTFA